MNRFVCIHGHFYQPPRENPWLEEIEQQDTAYPYHDWNERVTAECYAPNSASRILDAQKRILEISNNYSKISFNFGPTLLSWLEKYQPELYQSILQADQESQKKFSGHGSAIAQCYNHMIMPLANTRDQETQVIWGIKDFESRFKRTPKGMWLPETAVNIETLEILSKHNIQFTILASRQASKVKKINEEHWEDVSGSRIDHQKPYLCRLPSGRSMILFFYDGNIAQDVAFGGLLRSGEDFANRLRGVFPQDGSGEKNNRLVHIATDGETYGHHHQFGDMALAYCLKYIEKNQLAKLTIYEEFLKKHPVTDEVQIIENSSWSCVHGIERWRSDCGCRIAEKPGWNQGWRSPLRKSLDWLRDELIPLYEKEMRLYFQDPWQVRNGYISVILNRSQKQIDQLLEQFSKKTFSQEDKIKILKNLEMQRHAMLMYTSCGWFFDEISGIETIQIMQYSARSIQLARELTGVDLENAFLERLKSATSNLAKLKNGQQVYQEYVKPAMIDFTRIGVLYAITSLFQDYPRSAKFCSYSIVKEFYDCQLRGRQKLAIGKIFVSSDITTEKVHLNFFVFHEGDHNVSAWIKTDLDPASFSQINQELKKAFSKEKTSEVLNLLNRHLGADHYSLWDISKEQQEKVLGQILDHTLKEIEIIFRQIYKHHYTLMHTQTHQRISLPKALATTVEFILNRDLKETLEHDPLDVAQMQKILEEVEHWAFELDHITLSFISSQRINTLMKKLSQHPEDLELMRSIQGALDILNKLNLKLDLWRSQNLYFFIDQTMTSTMDRKAKEHNPTAEEWIKLFADLGVVLHLKNG